MQVCLNGAIALLDGIKLRAEMLRAEGKGKRRSGSIGVAGGKTGAPLEVGDGGGLVGTESQEQELASLAVLRRGRLTKARGTLRPTGLLVRIGLGLFCS